MNRLRLTTFVFMAILLAVVAYQVWPYRVAADIQPHEKVTVDGVVREYRLVVPRSLPAEPVPIVFAFHGTGESPATMASYSDLDRLAAENGFLLVYPAAHNSRWATLDVDPEELDDNPDVQFFDLLLQQVSNQFNIDSQRIYAVGMSNGASFAQLLACARPEVAAVAAHSGSKPFNTGRAGHPFAILLLAGADDPETAFMRTDADEYRELGHDAELLTVPGLGHEWSRDHNSSIWEFLNRHERTDR